MIKVHQIFWPSSLLIKPRFASPKCPLPKYQKKWQQLQEIGLAPHLASEKLVMAEAVRKRKVQDAAIDNVGKMPLEEAVEKAQETVDEVLSWMKPAQQDGQIVSKANKELSAEVMIAGAKKIVDEAISVVNSSSQGEQIVSRAGK